jgi:hypothetical protein
MKNTLTNKSIVVTRFLQELVTHLFGKGDIYHLEWEEVGIAPNGYDGRGHFKAKVLVSFSLSDAIEIEVVDFYLGDGKDYGFRGLTSHGGAGQFIKVKHVETGLETKLTHWGINDFAPKNESNEAFLKKLGL